MCLFSGGRLIKGVFVLSVSNPQRCHRSALCNSPLNCSFTAEMSTFTFWGFEHQDPEILPIGVLFFCRFSFFFISREKKKEKRKRKSICPFLLLDWLEERCGSCSSNRRGLLTSTFPFFPLFFTHPAHIYTHQPLSRQNDQIKKKKSKTKTESKVSAQGTRTGFKEREREQGDRTNNGSRFLLQGEKKKITSRNPDFFDLVSFLVINLCL